MKLVQLVARLDVKKAAFLIGPVKQELLTHVEPPARFKQLRDALRPFPELPVLSVDFENAAAIATTCRRRGVHASSIDFLLVAVARRENAELYTLDRDFEFIRRIVAFRRFESPASM